MTYEDIVRGATAERMLRAFPDLEPLAARAASAGSTASSASSGAGGAEADAVLAGHDEEQVRLMNEACIAVDYDDAPYAAGSKKTLHLMASIDQGLLHRAFSVFLFNARGELLLQQRAAEKITFPNLWTNTCCSHPLAIAAERGPTRDLAGYVAGVKQAAVRKLGHELGIAPDAVPASSLRFVTRIHYMAPSAGAWGEHEIDYILFARAADPAVRPEPNEVRATRWVAPDELRAMFRDPQFHFTPWFKLICENFLFQWWGNDDLPCDEEIRRML